MLRQVDLKGTPFDGLKSLPEDRKAVNSFSDRDEAMISIATGIRKIVESVYKESVPGMKETIKRNIAGQDISLPSTHINYGFEFYGNQINGGSFEIKK